MILRIGSGVGGGPAERLVQELVRRGHDAALVKRLTPRAWREGIQHSPRWTRLETLALFPAKMIALALRKPREITWIPTTNPFLLPFAMILTRLAHRSRVVPLVYDLYPDALEAAGLLEEGTLAWEFFSRLNAFWLPRADGVVFIGERMARHTMARYGVPRRWCVIETGASTSEFDRVPKEPINDFDRWCQERTLLAYVGNLGHMHDLETLAEALPRVLERYSGPRPLGVVIAASGRSAELESRWRDLDGVRFMGSLDDDTWARLMVRTDVAFVTLRDSAKMTCVPSKAFSALGAGCALAVVAPEDSDLSELVSAYPVGIRAAPGEVEAFAETLLELLEAPEQLERLRESAVETARARFDMPALAERWLTFLSQL